MAERVLVPFEGEGAGLAELSWGQRQIWAVLQGTDSSLPMGGARALPPAALLDFDAALLAKATADGRHAGYHAIGLRTQLATKSADAVILTSRLRGLWPRYGERITAEAQRVGRLVLGASATSSP